MQTMPLDQCHPAAAKLGLSPLQARIFKLLSQGITPATVAAAVSCDASYITQLTSDEQFREALAAAQVERLQENQDRLERYNRIEDTILTNLEANIGLVMDPMKLANILSRIANARPTTGIANETANQQLVTNNVLVLALPNNVARKFVRNSAGEVIEIDGEELRSMPSNKVLELAKGATNGNNRPKQLGDFTPEDV